jgi:hypothetical protein
MYLLCMYELHLQFGMHATSRRISPVVTFQSYSDEATLHISATAESITMDSGVLVNLINS